MQLFMDILKSLEGDNKVAVEERAFVQKNLKKLKNLLKRKQEITLEECLEKHLFMNQNPVIITEYENRKTITS